MQKEESAKAMAKPKHLGIKGMLGDTPYHIYMHQQAAAARQQAARKVGSAVSTKMLAAGEKDEVNEGSQNNASGKTAGGSS